MQQRLPHHHSAFAKVSFYAALNGYLESFDPTRSGMLGNSFSARPAESWLQLALELLPATGEDAHELEDVIDTIKDLIQQKKYDEARQLIQRGSQNAHMEVRRVQAIFDGK